MHKPVSAGQVESPHKLSLQMRACGKNKTPDTDNPNVPFSLSTSEVSNNDHQRRKHKCSEEWGIKLWAMLQLIILAIQVVCRAHLMFWLVFIVTLAQPQVTCMGRRNLSGRTASVLLASGHVCMRLF